MHLCEAEAYGAPDFGPRIFEVRQTTCVEQKLWSPSCGSTRILGLVLQCHEKRAATQQRWDME